jgi:hypothetical protein
MTRSSGLFWRALTAFLVLPGMIAFVVPFLLRPPNQRIHWIGLVPLSLGTSCFCGVLEISMSPAEEAWRRGLRRNDW